MRSTDRPSPRSDGARPHIAIYSHDAMGLGHLRRNLLIAETLAKPPVLANVLLISGVRELTAYPFPDGVDCLTLPSLQKFSDGTYGTRNLTLPLDDLLRIRSGQILQAVYGFRPDLLVVDKVPRGVLGELDSTLEFLRRNGSTRTVLGIRDVLDEPEAVRREWKAADNESCVRDHYDAIWVYGDPALHDPLRGIGLSEEVSHRVEFTGYLDPRRRSRTVMTPLPDNGHRIALCEVGGGQDGEFLADLFLEAGVPRGWEGILLTGPFMPASTREQLRARVETTKRVRLLEFIPDPETLLGRADRIVSMGGYNTLIEVITARKPALVIPRVTPRSEQAIRARLFSDIGLLEMLAPSEATPRTLSAWLSQPTRVPADACQRLDFNGLDRIPRMAARLLGLRVEDRPEGGSWRETA